MSKKRGERLKASDVHAQADYLFGGRERVRFSQAYPEIESLKAEVEETGDGTTQLNRRRHYSERNMQPYHDCHNPRCYNGGVNLRGMMDSMVASREEEVEKAAVRCQGYEGSPKGKIKRGPCFNRFKVRIAIRYKPTGRRSR